MIGAALPIIAALVLALTVSGYALARAGAGATAAACELSEPQMGTVARVDDGETLELADGSVVRLIGAKAPSPPLGWTGDHPWPLVEEAKQALDRLASGAEVELRFGGTRVDRHGHALAQVFVVKGKTRVWLQQALVAEGLARVYSFPDNRACVSELMACEAEARAARKGVWGVSAYRIRDAAEDPEQIARLNHTYQLVEGVVAAVGGGAARTYLNFGQDWHTDFTVEIERKDKPAFASAGLDLGALAGTRIRVRGWIEWRNGPMIRASHPEQIEMLPADAVPNPVRPEPHAAGAVAL